MQARSQEDQEARNSFCLLVFLQIRVADQRSELRHGLVEPGGGRHRPRLLAPLGPLHGCSAASLEARPRGSTRFSQSLRNART